MTEKRNLKTPGAIATPSSLETHGFIYVMMLEDCCDPIGWGQEEKQWHGGSKAVEQVCFRMKRERARETGQVLISSHSPAMERSSVCVCVF